MSKKFKLLLAVMVCAVALFEVGCNQNSAQQPTAPAEPGSYQGHFKGKTLTIIVPFSPGGGFDIYARLAQPFFKEYTGAAVVVTNMPGGGGLVGANRVYNARASDNTIGILGGGNLVYTVIGGVPGVSYEIDKYQYIGRVSADPTTLVAGNQYDTLDKVLALTKPKWAVNGIGEADFYNGIILMRALGKGPYDYDVITGWEGTSQWFSAITAGSVDFGFVSAGSSYIYHEEGNCEILLQLDYERDERIPDVPTIFEVLQERGITDEQILKKVETICNIHMANRVFAAGPNMPAADVEALKWAWEKIAQDPAFLASCAQANRPIAYMDAETLQEALITGASNGLALKPIFDEQIAIVQ